MQNAFITICIKSVYDFPNMHKLIADERERKTHNERMSVCCAILDRIFLFSFLLSLYFISLLINKFTLISITELVCLCNEWTDRKIKAHRIRTPFTYISSALKEGINNNNSEKMWCCVHFIKRGEQKPEQNTPLHCQLFRCICLRLYVSV